MLSQFGKSSFNTSSSTIEPTNTNTSTEPKFNILDFTPIQPEPNQPSGTPVVGRSLNTVKTDKADETDKASVNDIVIVDSTDKVAIITAKLDKLAQANVKNDKLKVLLCGTHYRLYSGYALIVFNLLKHLAQKSDLDVTLWAFQNFKQNNVPRDEIQNVKIVDAWSLEGSDQKKGGFGEGHIGTYLKENPQDVVIIYNDPAVISMMMSNIHEKLSADERKRTKFICYLDQVNKFQKDQYIGIINDIFDEVVAFTEYWRATIQLQLRPTMPTSVLPHGVDPTTYFPIDKTVARVYFNVPKDAFVIITANRCQPRKRLDHVCMVFADIVQRHQELLKKEKNKEKDGKDVKEIRPIRLLIATGLTGSWNLPEILGWEFKARGLNPELINQYVIAVSRPQQLSDREMCILYNCADCNIQCTESEGFGLTAAESLLVGVPQVANYVGGFKEFLNPFNSMLSDPVATYYTDSSRDSIGGLTEIGDVRAMASNIWKLYTNPALCKKLGRQGRSDMLQHF